MRFINKMSSIRRKIGGFEHTWYDDRGFSFTSNTIKYNM